MTGTSGTVLVTGASRGIGRASAIQLAEAGYDLVLWARTSDELSDTGQQVASLGRQVRTRVVDLADQGQLSAALDELDWPSAPAGLVLNAGSGRWQPIAGIEDEIWRSTLSTNLDASMLILRALLPEFRKQQAGLIVGVLSDSARHPFAGRAAYSASKAGLAALLEVARREARADGVRITALLPSRVDTAFQGSREVAGPGSRPGSLAAEDVARVIGWLFSLPPGMEVRELQLAALTAEYGPYEEKVGE